MIVLFKGLSSIFSGLGSKMEKPEKHGESEPDSPTGLPPHTTAGHRLGAARASSPAVPAPPLEIASEALLGGRTEVRIRHRGEIYRLTLTRAGKLILHK